MPDPARIRASYDRIARHYAAARDHGASIDYLSRLNEYLASDSLVLDLGCGAGLPVDRWLVDAGHRVVGLDLSPKMLALARENVPEAVYHEGDIAALTPKRFSVDAVVSFFALFHTPRGRHLEIFETVRSFLRPGGLFLVTTGRDDWEGTEDFLGSEMSWSHFDTATYRRLLAEAVFAAVFEDEHRGNAFGDEDWHPIFLARAG